MDETHIGQDPILLKIQSKFRSIRSSDKKRKGYPAAARHLVLAALEQKRSRSKIATAAGISSRIIGIWQQSAETKTSAVRLQVVKKRRRVQSSQKQVSYPDADSSHAIAPPSSFARIRLKSGVIIEISASALSASLITTLSEQSL